MDQSRFLQQNGIQRQRQNNKLDQLLDWASELTKSQDLEAFNQNKPNSEINYHKNGGF